jgi:hypothetical protein
MSRLLHARSAPGELILPHRDKKRLRARDSAQVERQRHPNAIRHRRNRDVELVWPFRDWDFAVGEVQRLHGGRKNVSGRDLAGPDEPEGV